MIKNWDIQKELRTKLVAVTGIPDADNRAWENQNFTPNIDGDGNPVPYIREVMMPADEALSANDEVEQVGIAQYDYFVPVGHSVKDAKNVADAVKHAFKPTTVLGGLVRIDRSVVLAGRPDHPWYQIPIQISYTVYSQNS